MNTSVWIFLLGLCVELGTSLKSVRFSATTKRPSNATNDPDVETSISKETYNKLISLRGQNECGVSGEKTGRIVGGEPAKLGAWPWIAALGQKGNYGTYYFFCGATLISNKHAISAAHCVADFIDAEYNELVLRFGDLDLNDNVQDGANPVTIDIKSFQTLKRYKEAWHGLDITLLTLKAPVQFNDLIRPICLPLKDDFFKNDFEGYQPFAAGWGLLKEGGEAPTQLMQVQLPLISWKECDGIISSDSGSTRLHHDQLCAFAEGKDTCQGDSGGPLMLPLEDKYYLYGVVSWGRGCAYENNPGVYNRVNTHLKWIADHLDTDDD